MPVRKKSHKVLPVQLNMQAILVKLFHGLEYWCHTSRTVKKVRTTRLESTFANTYAIFRVKRVMANEGADTRHRITSSNTVKTTTTFRFSEKWQDAWDAKM